MPIIKSAKKRVKVAAKATTRNVKTKRTLKTAVKAFHAAVKGKSKTTKKAHSKAQSAIDVAAKKKVMSKKRASRKKSQLAKAAKAAAGVTKTATKKTTVKKPAVKKAAPKKAVAKKPAAKKAVTKKPTTKKK